MKTHFELFFMVMCSPNLDECGGKNPTLIILFSRFSLPESLNVEFVCNVLVVADQLLITRLKEMCEVVITENRTFSYSNL